MARISPGQLLNVSEDETFSTSAEGCRNALWTRFQQWVVPVTELRHFLCVNRNMHCRLQTGPTCGLVTLRVCAETISENVTCPALLDRARARGFSSQGEMFSAIHLSQIANDELGDFLRAEVYHGAWDAALVSRLLQHLILGWPVMFAYDVAKNHEPSLQGGASAHWAAMKGFLIASTEPLSSPLPSAMNLFPYEGGSFWYLESPVEDQLDLLSSVDPSRLWIVCQHSKSKHQFIWSFESIKQSNHNLFKCDESKLEKDGITTDPDLSELRMHLVFLHPPTK